MDVTTPSDRLLYRIDEVMRLLCVGRSTVYELIGNGELVRVNIGRRALITAESLVAYVDRLNQVATA